MSGEFFFVRNTKICGQNEEKIHYISVEINGKNIMARICLKGDFL